ncbi:MAG TPA: hypothetical protein VNB90_14170 [Cytophagaceae bacterium]|jgi:hypothetical protein|nr:hypothetical protein [Cytophagaceae bacterium]
MNFPNKICFDNKGPKGGYLKAWIVGDDIPTSIQVKGTNDVAAVKLSREKGQDSDRNERDNERNRCRQFYQHRCRYRHVPAGQGNDDDDDDDDYNNKYGNWESRNRYQTLQQTLIMIKNGVVVGEYKYDVNGNLIVEAPKATLSSDSTIALSDDNEVVFSWTATTEVKVKQYNSQHQTPGSTTWNTFHIDRPLGSGSHYTSSDTPTEVGVHQYRLTVSYNDDNDTIDDQILLTQSITIAPPAPPIGPVYDAAVDYFTVTPNPDGQTVHLEWKTTTESNVLEFRYDKQLPGAADYSPVDNPTAVQAVGTVYSIDDPVSGVSGTILYRLNAVFLDGSTKVLAVQSLQSITA